MKAYIIDDELANREILSILIEKHFPEIEIIGSAENVTAFLNSQTAQTTTDILFLDILMPEKTGFDLLNQFTKRNFEVILITGFDEYAIQAFEHSVTDYLLKPIDLGRLTKAIERVKNRLNEKRLLQSVKHQVDNSKIIVLKNNKKIFIECSDIAYMIGESGGYTSIFCKQGESYTVSKPLTHLEREYENVPYFMRVSQSVIINLEDIDSSDKGGSGYIGLRTNNFEIFLPRRKKREVLQCIEAYFKKAAS